MNKIHSVVWSKSQNAWVVVAEGTKAITKAGGAGLKVLIALIMLSPVAANAATLPQGGTVTIGQGTIVTNGANEMVIKQNTDKLGINWQSFNVGADGRVVFDQPNANSVALNRVIGSDGSSILGKIDSNGQVFLINPNGVIFGKNAQVNVGGLVASTLDISDQNFKDGNYTFESNGASGSVVNNGQIKAASGGYVALIGKSVKNQGLIQATLGTAGLAAGDSVTVDMSGDGLLSLKVNKAAVGALVDNQGMILADGGQAIMTARAANALTETVVNNDGIIQAQTINNKAGKIFLDGGPLDGTGVVAVGGTLDASAPVVGDGGFIETSGEIVAVKSTAKITTKAAAGKTGKWLLDPTDFTISSGSGALTTSGIGADTLASALASSNVELQTSSAGSGLGTLNIQSNISWDADTTLTLTAHNNIYFGYGSINVNGANGGLVLNGGKEFSLGQLNANYAINLNGANSSLSIDGNAYTVIRNLTDLQNANLDLDGYFALAGNLDASATASWNGGLGFNPIGTDSSKFTGVFEGLGHTISNLYINRPVTDNVGLIGAADGAKIRHVTLENTNITGHNNVGALAGSFSNGAVDYIKASGSVVGIDKVGGLFGYASALDFDQGKSSINVTGGNDVGGFAGVASGTSDLNSIEVTGNVVATGDRAGGVVGSLDGNGIYLKTSGSVTGKNLTGGLFGQATGDLRQSFSTSIVKGSANVGGLVGTGSALMIYETYSNGSTTGDSNVGGLLGNADSGVTVMSSFSYNPVTSTGIAGGLVGRLNNGSSIYNAYAIGDVTGANTGGLVGEANNSSIQFAYSMGKAKSGLVSISNGMTVSDAFWNINTSGTASSAAGVGKTDAQMKDSSTFTNWNLDTTGQSQTYKKWRIYEGYGAPLLTFLMPTFSLSSLGSPTYAGRDLTWNDISFYGSSTYPTFWDWGGYAKGALFGVTSGGVAIRNAGTYTLDGIAYGQFGWNVNTTNLASMQITVKKAPILVNIGNGYKTYDGTTDVADGVITISSGLLGGDELFIDTSEARYSTKNAGSADIIWGNVGLSGADAGNYYINNSLLSIPGYSSFSNIYKKTISANIVNADKTYNGLTSTNAEIGFGGVVAGDDLGASYTSAAYWDKNAGADKGLAVNGLKLTGDDAANYTLASTYVTGTGTISKAQLTIGGTGSDKVYDGGTAISGISMGADSGYIDGSLTYSYTDAAFDDKNAGNGKQFTINGITVSGSGASNYTWNTSATGTAEISKAQLDVTGTAGNKVYDGTTDATATLTDNRIGSDDLTLTGSAEFLDKNAGLGKLVSIYGISVTGADAGNYTWNTTALTSADIAKAALIISANAQNKTYDSTTGADLSFTDDRLGSDDLVISGTGSFADKNAGAGKAVSITDIQVTGNDAGNYTWNTDATSSADIAKANLVITGAAVDKVYDGKLDATVNFGDNRLGSDSLTISGEGSFADKNAASGKTVSINGITVTGADAGNYIWNETTSTTATITKAVLNVAATGNGKVYDGSTDASASLSDNRIAGDNLDTSYGSASFVDKNAGGGKAVYVDGIVVAGADAGNYTWNDTASTTATITKALLNVSATASGKVYDGSTDATASLTDNRIAGDSLDTSYESAAFADKNTGAGKDVYVDGIVVTGADAGNYTWNTQADTSADISKAHLEINASAQGKTYDGTTQASADLTDNRIAGDDLTLSYDSASFADKNAGVGKHVSVNGLQVSGADAQNYAWYSSATSSADIAKASLTISASGVDKVYDGSTAASAGLADDRIGGDDLIIGYTDAAFSDKNAGASKAVTVDGLTVTGSDAGNYTWNTSSTTTATISKAVLDVTATGQGKVYNGSTEASVSLADNRVAGDDLTLTSSAHYGDKNAGTGKTVNVDGIAVSGADAGNYTWNATTTTTADISKAQLNVTGTVEDKVYDGSAQASVGSLTDNRIAGDDLILSADGASFSDKNAGIKGASINGIDVHGADAGNYEWNTVSTTVAEITKAFLNLTATAANKAYDGTSAASVSISDDRITGDSLQVAYDSASFGDKNAGQSKAVNVAGISISGTDAGNYTVADSAATHADISKANLTISGAQQTKKQGEIDPALSWKITDGTLYGSDVINGQAAREQGEIVGTYTVKQGSLSAGGNYDVSFVPGQLTIDAKQVAKPAEVTEVVATISSTKIQSQKSIQANDVRETDYRLLNLGMKLPVDEVFSVTAAPTSDDVKIVN